MADQFVEVFGEKVFLDEKGVLDLRNRGISHMNQIEGLGSLKGLSILYLGNSSWEKGPKHNRFENLEFYSTFNSLTLLDLSYNLSLKSLPYKNMSGCKSLEALILKGCWDLERFSIHDLPALKFLDLSMCISLKELSHPFSFKNCPSLVFLDLSDCYLLTNLPSSICELAKLEQLLVGTKYNHRGFEVDGDKFKFDMRLKGLPSCIGKLKNLKRLDLCSCGEITALPDSFGDLESLEILDLSGTNIEAEGIPVSITILKKLTQITFSNHIYSLLYPQRQPSYGRARKKRSYKQRTTADPRLKAIKQIVEVANRNFKRKGFDDIPLPFITKLASKVEVSWEESFKNFEDGLINYSNLKDYFRGTYYGQPIMFDVDIIAREHLNRWFIELIDFFCEGLGDGGESNTPIKERNILRAKRIFNELLFDPISRGKKKQKFTGKAKWEKMLSKQSKNLINSSVLESRLQRALTSKSSALLVSYLEAIIKFAIYCLTRQHSHQRLVINDITRAKREFKLSFQLK